MNTSTNPHKPASDDEEVKQWLAQIYADVFEIEYLKKTFAFSKRYPTKLAQTWKSLGPEDQSFRLIAYISKKPKMSAELVSRLPPGLIKKITTELKKYSTDIISGEEPSPSPTTNV